jgi:ASC-1-like (ASCH) protein
MYTLQLSLRHEYFDAIKSGIKTVEGRLNAYKFKGLQPGMNISFISVQTDEVIICLVQAINTYSNFEDMLRNEGINNMLPGIAIIEKGVAIYQGFPGYKDGVHKNGAIAIKFKVISGL